MKQEHVRATVALERMWIWARDLPVSERDDLSHTLLSGHPITYLAMDALNKPVGRTRIVPEDFPVTLVTEITL